MELAAHSARLRPAAALWIAFASFRSPGASTPGYTLAELRREILYGAHRIRRVLRGHARGRAACTCGSRSSFIGALVLGVGEWLALPLAQRHARDPAWRWDRGRSRRTWRSSRRCSCYSRGARPWAWVGECAPCSRSVPRCSSRVRGRQPHPLGRAAQLARLSRSPRSGAKAPAGHPRRLPRAARVFARARCSCCSSSWRHRPSTSCASIRTRRARSRSLRARRAPAHLEDRAGQGIGAAGAGPRIRPRDPRRADFRARASRPRGGRRRTTTGTTCSSTPCCSWACWASPSSSR